MWVEFFPLEEPVESPEMMFVIAVLRFQIQIQLGPTVQDWDPKDVAEWMQWLLVLDGYLLSVVKLK